MKLYVVIETWTCNTCLSCMEENVSAVGVFDTKDAAISNLKKYAEDSTSNRPNYFLVEVEPGKFARAIGSHVFPELFQDDLISKTE